MSLLKKIKKTVKKAAPVLATAGMSKLVQKAKVDKAVKKVTNGVAKRVGNTATALRAPSIKANINIKQLLTNPKQYVKDNIEAYKKDIGFAKTVYDHIKKGDVKGLGTQFVNDLKGAGAAITTGKAPAVDWKLDDPPIPLPTPMGPETYSEACGDPMPMYPMTEPVIEQPTYTGEEGGQSKKPLLIGVGVVAAIVILLVVTK